MKQCHLLIAGLAAAVAIFAFEISSDNDSASAAEKSTNATDDAAVERTRQIVQMLDNVYKQTIVLITDKYVHDIDDFPAGSAAVLLFKKISESGSHQVRLIDATGMPYDEKNVAKDDFERKGIQQLKAGEEIYEQVVQIDDNPHLRTVTPVPVVMKKCVMCHDHYADAAEGEPIGAISYTVPIN